jgi:hypothetical protein
MRVRSLLGHALDSSSKLIVSSFRSLKAPEDKESLDEAHVACVARPVDDRERYRRTTPSPTFSFSLPLLRPDLEILPETGQKSVRVTAKAELLEARYREQEAFVIL